MVCVHLLCLTDLHVIVYKQNLILKDWPEDCMVNWWVQIIWPLLIKQGTSAHINCSQSPYTHTLNVNNVRVCKVGCELITDDMHMAAVFMFTWVCPASVFYLGQWVGLPRQLTIASNHHEYIIVWNFSKFLVFLLIPTALHMFTNIFSNCTDLQKYTMHVH